MRKLIFLISFTIFVIQFSSSSANSFKHPHGQPEVFIYFPSNKSIIIDKDAIKPLLTETLADYKIVAYSIVGSFRIGKSFLMDYCLRYLYGNYKSINFLSNRLSDKKDWMGDENEPLLGFSWKAGKTKTTSGIVFWSDVFLHEENGEKTAIIIMDTQGLFDTQENLSDSKKIFAINSLFSSFLIFYLKMQIEESQTDYLQVVTNYAKMISQEASSEGKSLEKPFQDFLFLIRDWQHLRDHPYGLDGGNDYVRETLNPKTAKTSMQEVRNYINSSYENVYGFLLPHAGEDVSTLQDYDGRWSLMSPKFRKNLKKLIEWMFNSKTLPKKKILGQHVNGKEYYEFLSVYAEAFKRNDLPEIKDIYQSTIEKQFYLMMEEALQDYKKKMSPWESNFEPSPDYESKMDTSHKDVKKSVLNTFKNKKKMGSKEVEEKYYKELEKNLDDHLIKIKDKILPILRIIAVSNEQVKKMLKNAQSDLAKMETQCSNETNSLKGRIFQLDKDWKNEVILRLQTEKKNKDQIDNLSRQLTESSTNCEKDIRIMSENLNRKMNEMNIDHQEEITNIITEYTDKENRCQNSFKKFQLEKDQTERNRVYHEEKLKQQIESERQRANEIEMKTKIYCIDEVSNQESVIEELQKLMKKKNSKCNKVIKVSEQICEKSTQELETRFEQYQDYYKKAQDDLIDQQKTCAREKEEILEDLKYQINDGTTDLCDEKISELRHQIRNQCG